MSQITKFGLPRTQETVSRSSIRVPKMMLEAVDSSMTKAGYNKKQRSKWIEDITLNFLSRSDAANLIAEEFIVPGSTESIPVSISQKLDSEINRVLEQVASEEGIRKDRSAALRTAITQQLLLDSRMQLSPRETREEFLKEYQDDDE